MTRYMDKNVKLWLILLTLAVAALLAASWTPPFWPRPPLWENRPQRVVRGDIELYYALNAVISTVNVTLLIVLLVTYIGIYDRTKSEFTLGLIVFSMILLFRSLASNPLVHWTFGFHGFGLGPFAMLPELFTCIALAILLYLTVKY